MSEPSRSPLPSAAQRRTAIVQRQAQAEEEFLLARSRERRWVVITGIWFAFGWFPMVLASDGMIPLPWSAWMMGWLLAGAWFIAGRVTATELRQGADEGRRWLAERLDLLDDPDREEATTRDGADLLSDDHPYAADLDLLGPGSLYERLGTRATVPGAEALANRLLELPETSEREARAESVQELAADLPFRERMAVAQWEWHGRGALDGQRKIDLEERARLLKASLDEPLPESPGAGSATLLRALSVVFLAVLAGWITGFVPGILLLALWLVHLGLIARIPDLDRIQNRFGRLDDTLRSWSTLMELVAARDHRSERLRRLAEPLTRSGANAGTELRGLARLVDALSQRANIFRSLTTGAVLFTDLHARRELLRWFSDHREHLGDWIDAVSAFEADLTLAEHAARIPEPTWAESPEDGNTTIAVELAHPLLPPAQRVGNDLEMQGDGTIALLTGSNMSGKSTFLRALGLAAVMAEVGLPVAARRLVIPTFAVVTCMRVHDSIQSGSSRFHAEVHRLARCLEVARGATRSLVLLDEILAGTNSEERHAGTRAVLGDLARRPAAVLVATHDLSLTDMAELVGDRLQLWHFRDHVENGQMTFDYRMRPGTCPSTNALRVMRLAGLPVESDG